MRSKNILWLGMTLWVLMILVALLPVKPNDYWWYVRLGGDIIKSGAIPTADTYSFTHFAEPMVYHSWLSAVVFWALNQWGGITLTVFVRVILLGIFYVLIGYSAKLAGAGVKFSALLVFISAMAGSFGWAMRPQLFSYPLFALTFVILLQWRKENYRFLWLLPVIMALWVNFHGAFILGILLVGAALVGGGGHRKLLAQVFVVMLLTTLLNPRGIGAWRYVWTLLTDPASQTLGLEWQPPTLSTWQGKIFMAWILIMPIIIHRGENRLNLTDWLWFLGFGWMALTALRYVIWFLVILVPLTATMLLPTLGKWLDARKSVGIPALNILLMSIFLLSPLAFLPSFRAKWWQDAPPALSNNTPVDAARWLAQNPNLPGQLFSDMAFSSYLIYALPERPTFIDTRFELYSVDEMERYLAIDNAQWDWAAMLNAAGIRLMMLNPQTQSTLIDAVKISGDWDELYQDDRAIIFALND